MVHLAKPRRDDGHFSTREVRRRDEACLSTSRMVALPKHHYKQPPNLAAGFCALDASCDGPVRANLIADNITTDSFRIAVETWGTKSTLYEASAAWIEHRAHAKDCTFGQFDTGGITSGPSNSATAPKAKATQKHAVQTTPTPKKYAKPFFFSKAFDEPPEIVCWLNRLDLSSGKDHNYKVRAFADDVRTDGFSAHINTWADGELNGAGMCWIAFPRGKKHVDCGKFSTNDVRKRTDPRVLTTAKVKFKQRFDKTPTVLAALNMLDCAGNADLRVKLAISDVNREGFKWTLETWDDSTLYAAGASWIALGFD